MAAVSSVNCRVGSLETVLQLQQRLHLVNCRVGSLEKDLVAVCRVILVNCCVGSLENEAVLFLLREFVNCRVGSLEMGVSQTNHNFIRWFTLRVSAQAFRENGKHD